MDKRRTRKLRESVSSRVVGQPGAPPWLSWIDQAMTPITTFIAATERHSASHPCL